MKAPPAQASAARPIPAALSSRLQISVRYDLIVASARCPSIVANSFADATHPSCCAEVERNKSNHVAFFARFRSLADSEVLEPIDSLESTLLPRVSL